jgi:hypothetical protein
MMRGHTLEQIIRTLREVERPLGEGKAIPEAAKELGSTPGWETVRALMLAMGYEPDLTARRLRGRWDPVHLAASRRRSPVERLELAISANRLAGRLRQVGASARRGS